jgi:outer membrane protein TolC
MALADADEVWWRVRTDAGRAFYQLYAFEHQLDVMRRTLRWLDDLESVARVMYGAGTGRQSDVLRATVEVARMDASIATMRSRHEVATARLNAVVDRPADAPLASPVLPPLPAGAPPRDTLRLWAEETRPILHAGKTAIERARSASNLAARELWPDFALGLGYGEREIEDDTRRMASIMVGLNVPIFAGSRQLRLRDEAEAMERVQEARLKDLRAQVDAEIGEHMAELERARSLLALYRQEILPQAKANVESAFSLYRVGEVDFLTLVDAQLALNRFEQEYFGFIADYGIHIAELEMTVGRELPRESEILVEVP